jgi:hypothetical protein
MIDRRVHTPRLWVNLDRIGLSDFRSSPMNGRVVSLSVCLKRAKARTEVAASSDHLVDAREQGRRHIEAEGFRGLEIYYQIELG